ncbi:NAD(P)-dependent alcohol dehydrogenase [Apibacter raozihei]|uniref:NAD(P)-dependent alcohol dehydrogenase n=1 Tax=Apibacter raozihei TaxID=2500547 RepID=UPI000FE348E5|nr:NAD(P)-dependent alcohol dehydrogenase [Apibacter raozihei]
MKQIFSLFILLTMSIITFSQENRVPSKGLALYAKDGDFQPYEFSRHAIGDNDILIDIMYSGICHSDIHMGKSEWGNISYPFVGGHEIAGRVARVGKNVTKFKVGDYAGIGCIINSCGVCDNCKNGLENLCEKGMVGTYASHDYFHNNEITQGGYANNYVVSENYAIKIPENADMKKVAPLLCAGVTTYSPIHFSNVKKGDSVAVAGFGGLGHMAVQYLVALGANVTIFDITEEKRADAKKFGAVEYVNINKPEELEGQNNKYSFIISTIPAKYDPVMYVKMLKIGGEMAIVGLPASENMPMIPAGSFVFNPHKKIYGSLIGGIPETQKMLDYSVANNIYPEVEIINADVKSVTDAYKNVIDGKVKFRYVIDMKTLK